MALRKKKKEEFVYILGRQEYPVTLPWESTPRGISTCPKGSALAAHHSPSPGSPCAAQTVLKEGPSPEARRPSGTTCCVSLHIHCSLVTAASELRRRSQGNSGKSEALRVQHTWASTLPCHPETCYEGLGTGRPPGVSAGPGWGVRSWARFVASLSFGGHVLNLCDGIVSQGC